MNRDELRARVDEIRWFHTIDLGHGIVTPGADESPAKLSKVGLPASLQGKSVLDIGAWDGFFSFEAERRGAARVVSVDPECWRPPAWGPRGWGTRAGFDLAHQALGSNVEPVEIDDLLDISPARLGAFDVVLFLGIFYHLPDPWPYLQRAAEVASDLLILETHADLLGLRRPAMAYYPGEFQGDEGNYWGPNAPLLIAKLTELGFSNVAVFHRESLPYRFARSIRHRIKGPTFRINQGRLTLHARR